MLGRNAESSLSKLFLIGLPVATVLVFMNITDPINSPKLLITGALAGGVCGIAIVFGIKQLWLEAKLLMISGVVFVLTMLNGVIQSSSPLLQNLYGVQARNTGFFAYIFLLLIALSAALLREKKSFKYLSVAMLFASVINIAYGAWIIIFGDFFSWSNTENAVIGFFGNTNFMSAFLGMFIAGASAWSLSGSLATWQRISLLFLSGLAFYEIIQTNAIQGRVLTVAGLFVVGFYFLRSKVQRRVPVYLYSIVGAVLGFIALLGALQRGPLTEYIYKVSVSLRGQYWQAGIGMGNANPFSGVGMDAYGDNYRKFRSLEAATNTPGPDTTTNAAHNVIIDFFASGGWPLMLSYLATLIIAAVALVRVTLRDREYKPEFVAIASVWICYQLQSIISINQIGLAIWGWVLTGALVGYERATREKPKDSSGSTENSRTVNAASPRKDKRKNKGNEIEQGFTPGLVRAIGVAVGALLALPPLTSDLNWRTSLNNFNPQTIEEETKVTYFNPTNSYQLVSSGILLESNKYYDLSYKFAKRAVQFNPDDFKSWQLLLSVTNASVEDKVQATINMKRLDPLNPKLITINP
jgi:O-antigen ligase